MQSMISCRGDAGAAAAFREAGFGVGCVLTAVESFPVRSGAEAIHALQRIAGESLFVALFIVRFSSPCFVSVSSAKLCMMSGQSSSPVMHDACEDLGQNYLKADIIQSLGVLGLDLEEYLVSMYLC